MPVRAGTLHFQELWGNVENSQLKTLQGIPNDTLDLPKQEFRFFREEFFIFVLAWKLLLIGLSGDGKAELHPLVNLTKCV